MLKPGVIFDLDIGDFDSTLVYLRNVYLDPECHVVPELEGC